MNKKDLIGTWKLISFELKTDNGDIFYPLGKDAKGYLLYQQDGYMAVNIMANNRLNLKSEILFEETEKILFPNNYLSYSGTYNNNIYDDYIIHNIEICSFPDIGKNEKRFYQNDKKKLILTTEKKELKGKIFYAIASWEKN